MNRYDVASVAKFNPLSYQEIMAAPLAMRQKHDNSVAQMEAMRIQANPLNEHSARALEIKNQMDAEIAKNVDILNKEGYNPTTFQNITKLNRQYQDMISPTGEIGIINAAKIAEAKAKEDFMKNADKSFGQNVLEQKWLEHRQKYANVNGRDKDGKIINIDNLGSPKYVDLDTGIRDVLSTLGSTTKEKLLNSGLHFKNTNYGPVMVNAQGSVVTETNDRQLDDALNALKTRFINKTGEGRISRDFEGRTSDEDLAYINSRISAANVYKQNKDYKTNYDMISTGASDDKDKIPGIEMPDSIPEKVIPLNNNEDLLKLLKGPFTNSGRHDYINSSGFGQSSYTSKESTLNNNPIYIDLATKIKNATPSLKNLKITDQKVINKTVEYLNTHQNQQTVNRIITPSTSKDTRGYSADEIAKYTKTKQDAMETSIRNGMKVYDENGDEIEKPKSKSIIYNGEYTFNSITPIKSTNPKTKFSPISATMIDSDGNEQKVYVAQNPDREKDPLFKAQYTAFQTLNKAGKYRGLKQPLKNTFTEENLGLRDVNVTYNDDGSVILEGKHYNGKNWEEMPKQIYENDSNFVNHIYNLYK